MQEHEPDKDLIDALIASFNSGGDEALLAAAALGKSNDPRAFRILRAVACAREEETVVRLSAIWALESFGEPAVEPLVQIFSDEMEDSALRGEAAIILARKRGSQIYPELVNWLRDSNDEMRVYAVAAIGNVGSPDALNTLLAALDDRSRRVREEAVRALTDLGETGKSALAQARAAGGWRKRHAIARALKRSDNADASRTER